MHRSLLCLKEEDSKHNMRTDQKCQDAVDDEMPETQYSSKRTTDEMPPLQSTGTKRRMTAG